jgi:hypothetical protein
MEIWIQKLTDGWVSEELYLYRVLLYVIENIIWLKFSLLIFIPLIPYKVVSIYINYETW